MCVVYVLVFQQNFCPAFNNTRNEFPSLMVTLFLSARRDFSALSAHTQARQKNKQGNYRYRAELKIY